MKQEEWRLIPSNPDYAVSSLGRVRRAVPDSCGREPRILAQAIGSAGRAQVSICADRKPASKSVHRLVAEAFHGSPPEGRPMVCHKDGNPLNNRPDNLYYGTARTNGNDASRHGSIARGHRNGNSRLTTRQAKRIIADRRSSTLVAKEIGVSVSTVCRIRRGQSWKHLHDQPPASNAI
jgi:hypothetical protein